MRVFVDFLVKASYFNFHHNFKKKGFSKLLHLYVGTGTKATVILKYQGFGKLCRKHWSLLFPSFFFKTSQFKISTNSSFLTIKRKLDSFLFLNFHWCVRKSLYPVKQLEAFCIWIQTFRNWADESKLRETACTLLECRRIGTLFLLKKLITLANWRQRPPTRGILTDGWEN